MTFRGDALEKFKEDRENVDWCISFALARLNLCPQGGGWTTSKQSLARVVLCP